MMDNRVFCLNFYDNKTPLTHDLIRDRRNAHDKSILMSFIKIKTLSISIKSTKQPGGKIKQELRVTSSTSRVTSPNLLVPSSYLQVTI